MIKYLNSFFFNVTINDVAEPWGLFFHDNTIPQIEGLEELHNNIMFYLTVIIFAVSWIMLSIILNYRKAKNSKNVNQGTLTELTGIVAFVLILVLSSFFTDEVKSILQNTFYILCSNDVNGQFSEGETTTITEGIAPSDCAHDKAKYNWDINSENLCHICALKEANLICDVCSCKLHPECVPSNCDIDGDWKKD